MTDDDETEVLMPVWGVALGKGVVVLHKIKGATGERREVATMSAREARTLAKILSVTADQADAVEDAMEILVDEIGQEAAVRLLNRLNEAGWEKRSRKDLLRSFGGPSWLGGL